MKQAFLTFCHWDGWKHFGAFLVSAWRGTLRWKGWPVLFCLPFGAAVFLGSLCAAGLILVFIRGMEQSVIAYLLYPLSAWCPICLCAKLPSGLRRAKTAISENHRLVAFLKNGELHFRLELYIQQFVNFTYGTFKIASGITLGSAWIGCDGIYNMAQALIQLFQILRRKKPGTLIQQWRSYRLCGVLILLMHLTMTGIVFQMVNWNRAEDQGEIMIIATAAFAFYKFISSFLALAKDRRHAHPVDSSVRMLELSQAVFAIFSLQAGMLHTFGTGAGWEHLINLVTGCTVCLMTVAMGIYMIRRGSREIQRIKESTYGQEHIL